MGAKISADEAAKPSNPVLSLHFKSYQKLGLVLYLLYIKVIVCNWQSSQRGANRSAGEGVFKPSRV